MTDHHRSHPCPGCAAVTSGAFVACKTCFTGLPEPARRQMAQAGRNRQADPAGFAAAVARIRRLLEAAP